jgi:glycerophosphoryl diester phosphodiesterase
LGAPSVYAHRGSPDPARGIGDNSLPAFARARRLGADGVELDVRMTADGAIAVCHDATLDGVGPIATTRATDLPATMPMLPEALDACAGMAVNVELKDLPGEPGFDPGERLARLVGDVLARALEDSLPAGPFIVSSFWRGALEELRDRHPELPTGLLVAGWPDPAVSIAAAADLGCRAVHVGLDMLSPELVVEAHGAGLRVAAWTVRDRTDLLAARSAGVDTVISDDVRLARAVLGAVPGGRF